MDEFFADIPSQKSDVKSEDGSVDADVVVAPRHWLEMSAHVSQRAESECDPAWRNIVA